MATESTQQVESAEDTKSGVFARIITFFKQVIAELKKVIYPTREELTTYLGVVLVFILAMIIFTGLVDLGVSRLVVWVFAGK